MGMLYCRGCGQQMHESAPFCPHCGAPQSSAATATLQPVAGVRVGNVLVGFLAVAPLVGLVLEATLAGALAPDPALASLAAQVAVKSGQYWWVTLLLNVGLSVLDDLRLKRAGVDTSGFGRFAFVVPVYLWMRAKALGQSKGYFWVWIGTFVLSLLAGA